MTNKPKKQKSPKQQHRQFKPPVKQIQRIRDLERKVGIMASLKLREKLGLVTLERVKHQQIKDYELGLQELAGMVPPTIDDLPVLRFRDLRVGQIFYFLSAYLTGERDIRYKTSLHHYADAPDGYRKTPDSRETYVVVVQ